LAENYLIIANGQRTGMTFLKKLLPGNKIIVLDGAANYTKSLSLVPDIILGDLDSITTTTSNYYRKQHVKFVITPDQNFTDLEKAIHYCDQHLATLIVITWALGKRTDHLLGNIGFLKKYYNPSRKIAIITPTEIITYMVDNELTINGKKNQNVAIIGYPKCTATSHGLKYELNNTELELGKTESICNQLRTTKATLSIQGNAIIIAPYVIELGCNFFCA
jgi:thiamine pyrophosphokinase